MSNVTGYHGSGGVAINNATLLLNIYNGNTVQFQNMTLSGTVR